MSDPVRSPSLLLRDSRNNTRSEVRSKVEAAGLRCTRQRIDLATYIFAEGDRHFTAEWLSKQCTKNSKFPATLSTVYNTLNTFVSAGLIQRLASFSGRTWYDTRLGDHAHYYYEDEDRLEDVPEDVLPSLRIGSLAGDDIRSIEILVRVKKCPSSEHLAQLAA